MGILQEGKNKPIGFREKLNGLKLEISKTLSFPDPDAKDRQDLQDAKLIANEISGEWRSNNQQQNLDRIGDVHVGKAHVIFSRDGVEKSDIEGR